MKYLFCFTFLVIALFQLLAQSDRDAAILYSAQSIPHYIKLQIQMLLFFNAPKYSQVQYELLRLSKHNPRQSRISGIPQHGTIYNSQWQLGKYKVRST
jgi:hypothetical protein